MEVVTDAQAVVEITQGWTLQAAGFQFWLHNLVIWGPAQDILLSLVWGKVRASVCFKVSPGDTNIWERFDIYWGPCRLPGNLILMILISAWTSGVFKIPHTPRDSNMRSGLRITGLEETVAEDQWQTWVYLGGSIGKKPSCNAGDAGRYEFDPWVKKVPWRWTW